MKDIERWMMLRYVSVMNKWVLSIRWKREKVRLRCIIQCGDFLKRSYRLQFFFASLTLRKMKWSETNFSFAQRKRRFIFICSVAAIVSGTGINNAKIMKKTSSSVYPFTNAISITGCIDEEKLHLSWTYTIVFLSVWTWTPRYGDIKSSNISFGIHPNLLSGDANEGINRWVRAENGTNKKDL